VVRDEEADVGVESHTSAVLDMGAERDGAATPGLLFYLDGAHTPESMASCALWFAAVAEREKAPKTPSGYTSVQNVLLFNCMEVGTRP
jgi:folylpolyglutamate synthase